MADLVTLPKSVMLVIPNYFMQNTRIPKGICEEIERVVRSFIWGSTSDKRKTSLISWDEICQPKEDGGLGFQKLNDQNCYFILNLAHNILTNTNTLWVRVLRAINKIEEAILESITRHKASYLWNSLSKVWSQVRMGVSWCIGRGDTVRFWEDVWLQDINPLIHHCQNVSSINTNVKIHTQAYYANLLSITVGLGR